MNQLPPDTSVKYFCCKWSLGLMKKSDKYDIWHEHQEGMLLLKNFDHRIKSEELILFFFFSNQKKYFSKEQNLCRV